MKKDRGFSLLELLIVVAIILIIATIAIPSLLRSRQAANETAAVSNMKDINTAEINYSSALGGTFGTMSQLMAADLIDERFSGALSGYNYSMSIAPNGLDYTLLATAVSGNTGRYDYYSTIDYIIRYSTDTTRSPSGLSGQPIQ